MTRFEACKKIDGLLQETQALLDENGPITKERLEDLAQKLEDMLDLVPFAKGTAS